MSTRITINPKTGRVERKTTEQMIKDAISRTRTSPAPKTTTKTDLYVELGDSGVKKDILVRDESGGFTKTGSQITQEQKKTIDSGEVTARTGSTRSSGRSRSRKTSSAPRTETPSTITQTSTRTSNVIRRDPNQTIYIDDPIRQQSVPLIPSTSRTTRTQTQTSPPSTIRGTTTEILPDGSTLLRPMTEAEQKKADRSSSYGGRVLQTAKDYFTDYSSRVRLGERYRQDLDTTFDFRPESVGTLLGAGALLATNIGGARLGAGVGIRGVTAVSRVPSSIKGTVTALQTAQRSGRLASFLLEAGKKGALRFGITAGVSVGGGLATREVSRARQREDIQALRQLSDEAGFNIREEFREVRKRTERAISPVRQRDRDAFNQEAIKRGEEFGLTGKELTEYLQTTEAEFQQQTQFAEPFYKGVVFDLPGGQLLVGQQAFESQARTRGRELGLTGQQLDAYVKGLDAERKARGFGELSSAVISTWGAEATGRALNALTLKQFPALVTSTSKLKGVGKVAGRTFVPTGIASGQEAFITGVSEQIMRGETLRTIDRGKLGREVAISGLVGGGIGGGRAGLTASRTATGQITRPAKTAGLITDVFVYTADPFEVVGDFLESGRQIGVRKALRRPVLRAGIDFADPSRATGRFRVGGVFDTPSTPEIKVPDVRVPDPSVSSPRIPSPKIPDPRIPDPRIPDPRIPDPRIPSPRIPDPRIPDPKIPDIRVPDPKIPDPRIPDPRIPDPRIPSPRIPTLAFDWKMPPAFIPPLSLPTGSGGSGSGFKGRKKFVSELEQSQKLLGNLLGSGFSPQQIKVKKEDKKKKKKVNNPFDVDNVFKSFLGGR